MAMKKLTVETDTHVIIEYHNNTQACWNRISSMRKRLNVKKTRIDDVVRHIEVRGFPELTKKSYSSIDE